MDDLITLTLTRREALAAAERLGSLARAGAFDSDDLSEPMRWLYEATEQAVAHLSPSRGRRTDRTHAPQEVVS